MTVRLAAIVVTSALLALSSGGEAAGGRSKEDFAGVEECSGVYRDGDRLYLVGDDVPGVYYEYPLDGEPTGRVPLHPELLTPRPLQAGPYAMDLESVGRLADGRIVILSEKLSALLDVDGLVATYGREFTEFGGRGLEGLAIRRLPDGKSRVAVLWEGGYPEETSLPIAVRDRVCFQSTRPTVLIHDLEPDVRDRSVRSKNWERFELRVPEPDGVEPTAQRFRAPDLVWHRLMDDGVARWGLIVLMSSGAARLAESGSPEECSKTVDGAPARHCYRWIQRFTLDGDPYGDPFDLESVLDEEMLVLNWEGMAWFVEGESLVFVYDEKLAERRVDPQECFVLPLPEDW